MSEKEKDNAVDDAQLPSIVVGTSGNVTDAAANNKKVLEPKDVRKKRAKSDGGGSVRGKQGKLVMPSKQAGKLTTAINYLIGLKRAATSEEQDGVQVGNAENIVYDAIKKAEVELFALREELATIVPETELQQQYKDSWVAKNVQRKEEYLKQLKRAMLEDELNRNEESESSTSTSSSQEKQAALEEEALLLLEREQMLRRQELRKRQREEEMKEQQKRDDLQRKLLEIRSRASARSRSSVVGGRRTHNPTPRNELLPLPQVHHPTPEWLEQAGATGDGFRDEAQCRDRGSNNASATLMQQMLLSQAKVPCFKGDPLDYLWFQQSFEVQVERVTSDPVKRLYYLIQCLEGEPHRLVRGCQLAVDPEEGFKKAKELLNERYGHPIRQALAFKNKLLAWPTVKTGPDLTNFYIHLQQCRQVKTSSTALAELDSAPTLLALASKLPERLQSTWQTKAVDIEQRDQRQVDFDDFMKFVHRHESARNHPIFGKLNTEKKEFSSASTTKAKTFVTEAKDIVETTLKTSTSSSTSDRTNGEESPNAFKMPCLFCKGDHPAAKCRTPGITREQKKNKLKGLCFSCLKPGHAARFCKFRLKCDTCGKLHPTVMHEERVGRDSEHGAATAATGPGHKEEQSPGSSARETDIKKIQENSLFTNGSPNYAMATVKVKLWTLNRDRSVVLTALLDAASSATFISKDIVTALNLPTRPVSFNLSTMAGESTQQTSTVQGLKVSDSEFNHVLSVGVAYVVVDALPEVSATITKEEANGWPHLADICPCLPAGNEPIQMLIGQSVHGAHVPEDVRRGSDDEPFAIKTKLGWTVQGPLGVSSEAETTRVVVNFTKVEKQLEKMYYQDF